jgi:dolichol-phosphate mannosyltransferase
MKLSVVVPVRNEAENVESLILEIHQVLSSLEVYEMVFVDDGSTDQTFSNLKRLMTTYPSLRVLQHQRSYGQSRAIHSGVRAAQFHWIVTLDGDGQNDPADIPKLLEVLHQHQPELLWMLSGFRYQRHDSYWRKFTSWFANSVRQSVLHDQTPDTGCGLKLFQRDKFLNLPYFDHMHRFLPALMQICGGQVVSVKVNHRQRQFGVSKYGTFDRLMVGIIDILGVMWLKKRQNPAIITEVQRGD